LAKLLFLELFHLLVTKSAGACALCISTLIEHISVIKENTQQTGR
jgi:hypothetical protein